jgi:phage FluMu protein Com
VRRVAEVQAGLAVPCPRCATLHNVVMFNPGSTIPCRKCSLMIAVPTR